MAASVERPGTAGTLVSSHSGNSSNTHMAMAAAAATASSLQRCTTSSMASSSCHFDSGLLSAMAAAQQQQQAAMQGIVAMACERPAKRAMQRYGSSYLSDGGWGCMGGRE